MTDCTTAVLTAGVECGRESGQDRRAGWLAIIAFVASNTQTSEHRYTVWQELQLKISILYAYKIVISEVAGMVCHSQITFLIQKCIPLDNIFKA